MSTSMSTPMSNPMSIPMSRPTSNLISSFTSNCNGFKITFLSEKHVVEDDVLFTNHPVGK